MELEERRNRRRTVAVCMMANNGTLGLAFGSFGALLTSNEQALGAARDTISFGMSTLLTAIGLSALFLNGLVRRLTPRIAMAVGVMACLTAYFVLGMTNDLVVAFAMWALLGFGTSLAGVLAPVAIAAEHFPDRAGKFLGLVNLPLMLFAAPWAITAMLPALGRDGVYLLMAGLLLPVFLLAFSLPSAARDAPQTGRQAEPPLPARVMAARGDFWLITLGIAVIAGTGAAFTVHAIPFAETRDLPRSSAALMLSIYSGAGLAGVPLFGWLSDRLGPPLALAGSAALQSLCWLGLALAPSGSFYFLAAILGLATTPLTTLHGAAIARLFGASSVSRAMGISYALKLPFLFVIAPAVGYSFVQLSDYRPAFLAVATSLVFALLVLLAGAFAARGRTYKDLTSVPSSAMMPGPAA